MTEAATKDYFAAGAAKRARGTDDKKPVASRGVYGKPDQPPVDWPDQLLLLPRSMGLMAKDLGIKAEERKDLVRRANKNDADAIEKIDLALNVVLECMGKFVEERQYRDPRTGNLMFLDHNGNLTARHYSDTLKDDKGNPIAHERAMEQRSPWGVRAGYECQSAAGTEMPTPGYWKSRVIEHFDDLLPRLKFLSDVLDPSEADPTAARPESKQAYDAYLKEVCADDHYKRRELLEWLKPFLKNPGATWNGED